MNDWLVDGRELKPTEIKRAAWESQTRKWNSYQGLENWKYHHCHLPHLLEGDAGTKQETTTCRRNLLFNYHVRDRPEINVMSEIRQPKHYKLSHSHSPVCGSGVFLHPDCHDIKAAHTSRSPRFRGVSSHGNSIIISTQYEKHNTQSKTEKLSFPRFHICKKATTENRQSTCTPGSTNYHPTASGMQKK